MTLAESARLLEDVQTLVDMPPRLQKLEDAKVRSTGALTGILTDTLTGILTGILAARERHLDGTLSGSTLSGSLVESPGC